MVISSKFWPKGHLPGDKALRRNSLQNYEHKIVTRAKRRSATAIFVLIWGRQLQGAYLMKALVRGALVSSIMVMFVAFVYAQTRTETGLSSAKTSQKNLIGSFIAAEAAIDNVVVEPALNDDKSKGKKLVEKTASSKAVGNRGSFTATAYCLKGRTAMGHGVRHGIIAADPRVLK